MPRCEECQGDFETQEGLDQHNIDKHQSLSRHELKKLKKQQKFEQMSVEKKRASRNKLTKTIAMVGGVSFVLAAVIYTVMFVLPQGQQDNTITTATGEFAAEGFIPSFPIHWHPNLRIVINGEEQIVSGNIGNIGGRLQPIHTHEANGRLHIEISNPTPENMRLSNFFNVWRKPFNKDCIFEFCNGEEGTVKFFVNGEPSDLFENYIFADLDELLIEYS